MVQEKLNSSKDSLPNHREKGKSWCAHMERKRRILRLIPVIPHHPVHHVTNQGQSVTKSVTNQRVRWHKLSQCFFETRMEFGRRGISRQFYFFRSSVFVYFVRQGEKWCDWLGCLRKSLTMQAKSKGWGVSQAKTYMEDGNSNSYRIDVLKNYLVYEYVWDRFQLDLGIQIKSYIFWSRISHD